MRVDLAAASDVATAVAGSKEGSCGAGLGGGGGEGSADDGGPTFGGDEAHCAMEPDTMRNQKRADSVRKSNDGRRLQGLLQRHPGVLIRAPSQLA